jgi:hypothetical protein
VATPPTPKTVALRIELLEVVPLVWRRVLVADQWTLASLHHYLHGYWAGPTPMPTSSRWAMASLPRIGGYRRPAPRRRPVAIGTSGAFRWPPWCRSSASAGNSRTATTWGMAGNIGFVIESPPASTLSNPRLPVCIAGENACPPEDVGGPHGYEMFLNILGARGHAQHEDMVRWIGGVFDPKGFDLNRLNRDWKAPKRSRRA